MTWTWDKVDYLYKNYSVQQPAEICKNLGVSASSMLNEASKLLLQNKGEFTCKERALLQEHGENLLGATMFLLEGRTSEECAREVSRIYP